ncbi:phage integrase central domain-containing protein [Photobacterium leiognathi]|uniref:phage integrase central domain-containing protein n=1 Tax=Photobacterium leiognathi TaxID=553611 RepID=UPI00273664D0|nr:integrase arm-type DNA-binding domain-containing protein [Photobacterium leiognathi]
MARKITRLTDKQIKSTIPKDKEFTLSDGDGLQLRIRASGTKSWQFKFKAPISGTQQKITLGVYPHLTLANARKKALEYQELLSQKINPKEHIKRQQLEAERQQANTFSNIAKLWFSRKSTNVSVNHASREWRTLEKYVLPALGNIPVSSINAPDTIALLRPIEQDGKHSTIKRICQSLNQIMDYAVNHGLIHANPLAKIIKVFKKNTVIHMPTIRPEELPEFLEQLNSSKRLLIKTKLLILWQLHTMTRPKEAATTRWDEIDFKNKVWTIPADKMKQRKDHRIPLTQQSMDILNMMRPLSEGSEYIFSGEKNFKSHVSLFTANAAIKRTLGYKGKLVAHGLRAIASTALHEHGFDSLLIEACLSHADQNEVRASYNRSDYLEQRKEIMNWWSAYIEEAAQGSIFMNKR